MANLLEISRKIPPPKILILTRCQRFLSVPYLQESLSGQFTVDISQDTSPKILNLTRFQRYLSVPYVKERFIWPIYWRYLAGYLQLKY